MSLELKWRFGGSCMAPRLVDSRPICLVAAIHAGASQGQTSITSKNFRNHGGRVCVLHIERRNRALLHTLR